MKEQKNILTAYKQIDFTQHKAAIATVVKVRGSSYRSPGARMLITDDGKWVGSISGGCLEGDALRKSRQVMIDKKPMTVTYDTREESNQKLGIGLGCNGIIDVLIEPIDAADENNPVALFESFIALEEAVALATIFSPGHAGGKLLLFESGAEVVHSFSPALQQIVRRDLREVFAAKRCEAHTYQIGNETVEVYIELIQPVIRVIIFGGGFDARPVSQLAKSLGWNVVVTDECVAHIAPVFFPDADKLSLCQREFIDRDFTINSYTACLLMSHNYEYDRDVLRKIIQSDAPYIGILGPRKRFDKMVAELAAEDIRLSSQQLHKIHSPVGLDIGAETPDEIALSIIGEIQGKFANRSGGFLKYRNGPIHHRDLKGDQVFKQVYIAPGSRKSGTV
jgi:xanthine dehydrogenase accessory factor